MQISGGRVLQAEERASALSIMGMSLTNAFGAQ